MFSFGVLSPIIPLDPPVFSAHKLGQLADAYDGLVPLRAPPEPVRTPPPLPLVTYLVMVQEGANAL
jgi:hypothetical protein